MYSTQRAAPKSPAVKDRKASTRVSVYVSRFWYHKFKLNEVQSLSKRK